MYGIFFSEPDSAADYERGEAAGYISKTGRAAAVYPLAGRLYHSRSGHVLLSVPNAAVRGLFDAVGELGAELPRDGGEFDAHVVVLTPAEVAQVGGPDKVSERGHEFHWGIGGIRQSGGLGRPGVARTWWARVSSPELTKLRRSYGLPGYPVGDSFHLAIAVRRAGVLGDNGVAKSDGAVVEDADLRAAVALAAAETDTGPSAEQKKAGNYRKGKFRWRGREIAIETPSGATRSGVGKDGAPWSVKMRDHYGYFKLTESEADGDHLDVFIGPEPEREVVYVVNQLDPGTRRFDEHKIMLGYPSAAAAERAYLANYSDGWKGLGSVVEMSLPRFLRWLESGDTSRSVKAAQLRQLLWPAGSAADAVARLRSAIWAGGRPEPLEKSAWVRHVGQALNRGWRRALEQRVANAAAKLKSPRVDPLVGVARGPAVAPLGSGIGSATGQPLQNLAAERIAAGQRPIAEGKPLLSLYDKHMQLRRDLKAQRLEDLRRILQNWHERNWNEQHGLTPRGWVFGKVFSNLMTSPRAPYQVARVGLLGSLAGVGAHETRDLLGRGYKSPPPGPTAELVLNKMFNIPNRPAIAARSRQLDEALADRFVRALAAERAVKLPAWDAWAAGKTLVDGMTPSPANIRSSYLFETALRSAPYGTSEEAIEQALRVASQSRRPGKWPGFGETSISDVPANLFNIWRDPQGPRGLLFGEYPESFASDVMLSAPEPLQRLYRNYSPSRTPGGKYPDEIYGLPESMGTISTGRQHPDTPYVSHLRQPKVP